MKIISAILIAIIVVGLVSAVITAIPKESATKVSRLGYKSVCSFAPFSTTILAAIAFITFLIGKRFIWG